MKIHSGIDEEPLKELAKNKRKAKAKTLSTTRQQQIEDAVSEEWEIAGRAEDEAVPEVIFQPLSDDEKAVSNGTIRLRQC